MAVAYIKGVQGEGVIATVKHFAANNQEYQRNTINAVVDERVLNEIYFPTFRAALREAGVWSVMAAYNKLNGAWCAENPHPLSDVLLFGDGNPSGKLPVSFPKKWEDSPAFGHYPGKNGVVTYAEGLDVGYRHFDRHNIEPLFPFGYGLSYTHFDYSDLSLMPRKDAVGQPVQVSLKVRNIGLREGAEVVELYVHEVRSSVDRSVKELRAFRRVALKSGETQSISFSLDKGTMAYYDAQKKDRVAEPGTFEVLVGASSQDIRLKGTFELAQ